MSAQWPTNIASSSNLYTTVNLLTTTLSVGMTSSTPSVITVADVTGFPTAGAVTMGTETIFYTGVSGSTLTGLTRGADGTTAASHSIGVPVSATVIAYHINSLNAEVIAIETDINARFGRGASSNTIVIPSGVSTTFSALTATTVPYLDASKVLTSSDVTPTELGYISGVSSAVQTQINAKAPSASPTFTGTVTMPTPFTLGAISVTATGTELNYSVGVTSSVQTQINTKAPAASPTFTGTVTIPTPFTLGAVSVTATGTELNYVAGVTSAIQTQMNAKAPLASPTFTGNARFGDGTQAAPAIALSSETGTGLYKIGVGEFGLAVAGTKVLDILTTGLVLSGTLHATGAVTLDNLTASTVPYVSAGNVLTSSAVTPTELGYVSGVTSAIQTQLALKAPLASPTFTGTVVASGDLYTDDFTDYSSTSTIVGWSSFTTQQIFYKKIGKLVFIWFVLAGTSNSATTTFTLPYQPASVQTTVLIRAQDNGGTVSTGLCRNSTSTTTVTLNKDPAANAFTSSGTKFTAGEFFYQTT